MTEQHQVIYIEDNTDNQRLVARVLGARGFEVMLVDDGLAGLALARETTPLLILVDINIPGLDGYETTTRLRSMPHLEQTPIVALTADVSPGARDRALVAGCDGYLSKPIDPRRLPQQVAEFIAGKREYVPPTLEKQMLREYNQKVAERLEQQVRELLVANAELQEVDRLKNQFLTTLSHELRTPLTSLAGYLELFEKGTLGALSDMQRDAVSVMRRNLSTLTHQVNNLLYLQEARTSQLSPTNIQLDLLVQRLLGQMTVQAQQRNIQLSAYISKLAPIRADPAALEMALCNLLDNAIKFTASGGQVLCTLREEPARVFIAIEDTGQGIPAEALDKIFLPFYRVDTALLADQPGSGVGLALVRHVVEAHGGQVTVRSTPGQGSIFTVLLPRS